MGSCPCSNGFLRVPQFFPSSKNIISKFLNLICNTSEAKRNSVSKSSWLHFQSSADVARRQLKDLGKKIGTNLQPVYTTPKMGDKVKLQDNKPPLVTNQCLVSL